MLRLLLRLPLRGGVHRCGCLQPVHQALLVEGADEDDVTDASGVDDDEEPVQLETLLSQVGRIA